MRDLFDEKVRISPCERVHVEELDVGEAAVLSVKSPLNVDVTAWHREHLIDGCLRTGHH